MTESAQSPPVRVIKIGGSLLTTADLPARLLRWIEQEPDFINVVIVGGGEIIEAVRGLAAIHPLSEEFLHWHCVELLDFTCDMLAELIPSAIHVISARQFDTLRNNCVSDPCPEPTEHLAGNLWIVRVRSFYNRSNWKEQPVRLPLSWDTTSDSIAALLAHILHARQLVLMKSCDCPESLTIEEAAEQGIVDNAFREAAHKLSVVRLINLNAQRLESNQ